jgi:hypothetical protein
MIDRVYGTCNFNFVEPIESDPAVVKFADEIRSLISQNQEVQAKLQQILIKHATDKNSTND